MNTNETPFGQNQFIENILINDCIDVDTTMKEINDSLTRNDDVLEQSMRMVVQILMTCYKSFSMCHSR